MSGKNSNWLSDIKQCIHYKEPDLDCTLIGVIVAKKDNIVIILLGTLNKATRAY